MSKRDFGYAMLTVIGPDQVGILATASAFLLDRGADLLEQVAHVNVLGHGILHTVFMAPLDQLDGIVRDAEEELSPLSAFVTVIPEASINQASAVQIYQMDVVAVDEPGIAAEIENRIAELGVNIREVKGRKSPIAGKPEWLYFGSFDLEISNSLVVRQMRQLVQQLQAERHWDIDFCSESRAKHAKLGMHLPTEVLNDQAYDANVTSGKTLPISSRGLWFDSYGQN